MTATRQATSADERFLEATFLTSLRHAITAARGEWNEAREREQLRQQLELDHTQIIESEGTDVGFFMVRPSGRDLELHTICIAPAFQAQGFGSEAARLVVETAVTRNVGVVLSVLKVNGRARTFFERHGFFHIGESAHHIRLRHVGISLSG